MSYRANSEGNEVMVEIDESAPASPSDTSYDDGEETPELAIEIDKQQQQQQHRGASDENIINNSKSSRRRGKKVSMLQNNITAGTIQASKVDVMRNKSANTKKGRSKLTFSPTSLVLQAAPILQHASRIRSHAGGIKDFNNITNKAVLSIHCYDYSEDRFEHTIFKTSAELAEDLSKPKWASVRWVDIEGMDPTLLKMLDSQLGVHPLALDDIVNIPQPPKVAAYGNMIFMVANMITEQNPWDEVNKALFDDRHANAQDMYKKKIFEAIRGNNNNNNKKKKNVQVLMQEQVSILLFKDMVITIQEGAPGDVWAEIRESLNNPESSVRNHDAGYLLYSLVHALTANCYELVQHFCDILQDIELKMLDRPTSLLNHKVYTLRRELVLLKRNLAPTKKIIDMLVDEKALRTLQDKGDSLKRHASSSRFNLNHSISSSSSSISGVNINSSSSSSSIGGSSGSDSPKSSGGSGSGSGSGSGHLFSSSREELITSTTRTYFADVQSDLAHVLEVIETYNEMAASLSAYYTDKQGEKMNKVMYVLGIVSAIFIPLTFIAGVYGMNFEVMPELKAKFGYLYVWILMLLIVVFEILVMWYNKWFSNCRS